MINSAYQLTAVRHNNKAGIKLMEPTAYRPAFSRRYLGRLIRVKNLISDRSTARWPVPASVVMITYTATN